MITYKSIINACKAFADNHHVIKGFGNGELWQINDHDQDSAFEYPLHYMVDVPSSPGANSWVYAFRVYFVSRVEAPKDRDGNPIYFEYTSEKSAMIACAQDFLSYWVQDVNYQMTIDKSLGVTTFIDAQQDGVTGCYVDIRFVVPFDYNNCILPMDDVPAPRLLCLPVSLSLDNNVIASIASGDSYNITLKDIDGNPVVWSYNEPLKILTIQLGACDPVTMTYNGVSITSTDAGGTKTITVLSESLDPVGTITVDTSGQLTVIIANATIVNQSPGATWTDTVYASGSYILQPQPWTDSDGSPQLTPYNPDVPIVCTPCVTPPQAIGTIFDVHANELLNLNDFTIVKDGGTAITLDQGYIKITGSPATPIFNPTLDNYIQFNGWTTGLETWTLTMDFIIKSYVAADEGIILGWRNDSTITTARSDWYVHYRRSGSTATGDGYRYFNGTTTLTPNTFNTNPLTAEVTPVVDNHFRMKLERSMTTTGARFTLTITNLTTGASNSGSIDYTYQNTTSQFDMSSSKFFIGTTGGTHWVTRLKLESNDYKNPNVVLIGDSMTAGYNATLRANHYVELLRAALPSKVFTKSACQGDRCSTVSAKLSEIALINATTANLFIGTNDAASLGAAAAIANYDAMYADLVSIGITDFVHTTPLPRQGLAAMLTLRNHIIATYTNVVDAYAEADDPGNPGWIKASYTADDIHGNDAFWSWYYAQLLPYYS